VLKLNVLCLGIITCSLTSAVAAEDHPRADISNGLVRAEIMLPDAQRGSYRGTRFDWSGIVSSLQFAGHQYTGPWHDYGGPLVNDAVTGPAEEFITADEKTSVGYADAKTGGTFIRIGVGAVRKPDEPGFRRMATYEIADPGKWTIHKRKDSVEFVQQLNSQDGYRYTYTKTLSLTKGKAELVVEHSLKNTGRNLIDTLQYSHNFFAMDNQVVGPDVSVRFGFVPKAAREMKFGAEVNAQQIAYSRELDKGQTASTDIEGFAQDPKDYDIRVENKRKGTGVRITSDQPLAKLHFWSIRTVACPEAYVHVRVEPGQESHWTVRYNFYTLDSSAPKN
jgi:hypothetical protein